MTAQQAPDGVSSGDASQLPTLDHLDDGLVEAVGLATEALEYVERARGHLYSLHQLTGRADFLLEDSAKKFRQVGHADTADELETELIGRNVLDGRWTFQVVEEFERTYYDVVRSTVLALEARLMEGHRHVHEARLKARRRTAGVRGHEAAPPARWDAAG
jgi:hypothetical protein